MRFLLLVFLCSLPIAWAAAPAAAEKPACNAHSVGSLWPAIDWPSNASSVNANQNGEASDNPARNGTLEICTRGLYRYRWQSLTVSYQKLMEAAKAKQNRSRETSFPSQ